MLNLYERTIENIEYRKDKYLFYKNENNNYQKNKNNE